MPWIIVEEQQSAMAEPPGEPVRWDAVPEGAWVWLVEDGAYGIKVSFDVAECGRQSVGMNPYSPCIPCPPDWRFEASVVDGSLRFVPLVEAGERKDEWFNRDDLDAIEDGALVSDSDGGWHVVDGGSLTSLIRSGDTGLFRRPRGPVTLVYTPPTE